MLEGREHVAVWQPHKRMRMHVPGHIGKGRFNRRIRRVAQIEDKTYPVAIGSRGSIRLNLPLRRPNCPQITATMLPPESPGALLQFPSSLAIVGPVPPFRASRLPFSSPRSSLQTPDDSLRLFHNRELKGPVHHPGLALSQCPLSDFLNAGAFSITVVSSAVAPEDSVIRHSAGPRPLVPGFALRGRFLGAARFTIRGLSF